VSVGLTVAWISEMERGSELCWTPPKNSKSSLYKFLMATATGISEQGSSAHALICLRKRGGPWSGEFNHKR
jgi:hypothetical protein